MTVSYKSGRFLRQVRLATTATGETMQRIDNDTVAIAPESRVTSPAA